MSFSRCFPALAATIAILGTIADTGLADSRTYEALRVNNHVNLDGNLSDPAWQRPGYSDFTQRDPDEGASPSQKTEVWFAYDDAAFYVAARLHDTAADSIISRIGRRDADLNCDAFFVGIDSYHDKRSAFYFGVSPGGSIADGTIYNDENDDDTWDGVWSVATTIDDQGWIVEMRIPYSQLRFRQMDEHVWGINCLRIIERRKEEDWLVMVPKKESGGVSLYADLVGIRNIEPPHALEILPYAVSSGTFKRSEAGNPFNDGKDFNGNFGADIKWGIGNNLTLNATINPDFGQVEVDPAIVNLSQFETFFEEKRPFFIEGSNFFDFGRGGVNNNWGFNWGSPDYFYSRRIGRQPRGDVQHDGFTDIPNRTTILSAGKLTGKLSDTWSIGAIEALTEREYGTTDSSGVRFSDVVEPFTSYSVVRTLGEFNEGKQGLGFLGTASVRNLNQPYLVDNFNHGSYTFGIDGWTRLDSNQMWAVTAWASATHITGSKQRMIDIQHSPLHYFQRPDVSLGLDSNATSLTGYAGRVAVNKQKGSWLFNSAIGIISPRFDSNDLGFMFNTNLINGHVVVGYRWTDPDGTFRRKTINVATFRNYEFGGSKTGEGYFVFLDTQLMNFWGLGGNLLYNPPILEGRSTRGGPFIQTTRYYGNNFWIETDSREPLVFGYEHSLGRNEAGASFVEFFPSVTWKPTSNISVRFSPRFWHDIIAGQYVTQLDDPTAAATFGRRYVYAKLDQKEVSASIRLDWTFTPQLSLQLFVQPLVSVGKYYQFKELARPRTFPDYKYGENASTISFAGGAYTVDPDGPGPASQFSFDNPDFNYKSLRGNAVLRWEYLPGSTLYLVWTQNRENTEDPGEFRFHRDFGKLLSSNAENVLLLKVAYWLNP